MRPSSDLLDDREDNRPPRHETAREPSDVNGPVPRKMGVRQDGARKGGHSTANNSHRCAPGRTPAWRPLNVAVCAAGWRQSKRR